MGLGTRPAPSGAAVRGGTFELNTEQELLFSSCLRWSLESGPVALSGSQHQSQNTGQESPPPHTHVTAPLGWSLGLWALPFANTF